MTGRAVSLGEGLRVRKHAAASAPVGAAVFDGGATATDVTRRRIAGRLDRVREVLLVGTVALAPLGLGGDRVWSWTVLQMLVAVAVLVWLARMAVRGEFAWVRLGGVGVVGLALVGRVLLQMAPLPREVVSAVSPRAAASPRVAALHDAAHEVLGLPAPAWMTVSIAPHATRVALAKWLMYGALFVLVLNHVRTRDRALRLLAAIVVVGVAQAAYGIYERFSAVPHIFWWPRLYQLGSATGTFINRNHFASFLAAPLVLALAGVVRHAPRGVAAKQLGPRLAGFFSDPRFGKWLILAVAAVVLVVGIALSTSRGAMLALGATALVALATLARKPAGRRAAVLVTVVVLVAAAVALWRGCETLAPRFALGGPDGASITDRLVIWRKTLPVIGEYPVLGAGLGAFQFAQMPHAHLQIATRRAIRAHNEYLQWTAELGVAGAVMLATLAVVYLVWFVKGFRHCRDRRLRLWSGACLLAALPILVHARCDFGLHVPAVSILLVTVLALAAAVVRLSRTATEQAGLGSRQWRPKSRRRGAVVASLLAVGVLGLLVWPARDLLAWAEIRDTDVEEVPSEAAAARARALAWTPDDPELLWQHTRATRAALDASCREKVAVMVRLLTGGRPIRADQVPAPAQEWLAPAVWADGAEWLTVPLARAVESAERAVLLCPGKAEFHLMRAHLELDRLRAGLRDEERLDLADRAADLAVTLAPNTSWVALDAGQYWATRWRLAPTPQAKANYERLLARAVRLNPGKSYEALRTAFVADGSLRAPEALASEHAFVQEELRKLRVNLDPTSPRRVTAPLP